MRAVPLAAQTTQRVSVDSSGAQGNHESGFYGVSISADGRYVAFQSDAENLVGGDWNGWSDIFVRDRQLGTTERVSVDSGGAQVSLGGEYCSISADGRFVAFMSIDSHLVPGDTNGWEDIFVRDRQFGTTERVNVTSGGAQASDGHSFYPSTSADGRYVVFWSQATNLVPGDTNGLDDVFVRDRQTGLTELISVDSSGVQGNLSSGGSAPAISADGRFVAFRSYATNLVPGDTNGFDDVFVRDRQLGTTERVSVDSDGAQGNGHSAQFGALSISADGRYVAFMSHASNLVPGDTNGKYDVFVRDRQLGTTERVSVDSGGAEGNGDSGYAAGCSISADGRYVAFMSYATNLVPGDTNGTYDVFVRDRQLGTTERVSVDSGGAEGDGVSGYSDGCSISADGRYVVFGSFARNLVPGDTNGVDDVFVRDRLGGSSFTSLCEPGVAGVIACPCANAPGGGGRGCDNSTATGGASIAASGATFLSSDSLVFTTSGEKPTATSVLLQGTTVVASGTVYGQGVRCVGGTLKRLFTKTAVSGAIAAPNFAGGDPTISARSAAKGNPISAGQSRWYLVFYRDPVVLGGCPSGSTFNATQTGQISWSP